MKIGKPYKKKMHAVPVCRRVVRCALRLEHECDRSKEIATQQPARGSHTAHCVQITCIRMTTLYREYLAHKTTPSYDPTVEGYLAHKKTPSPRTLQ